jgi:cytochrome P450
MSAEPCRQPEFTFDRHGTEYRDNIDEISRVMHRDCPLAWNDTYGGHWFAAGYAEVFELARGRNVSSDFDYRNERRGYRGVGIPSENRYAPAGFIEMDPPEQQEYRRALDPYLSPAAVARWQPFIDAMVHACLDEKIETGRIDFVDDLANIVPAVLTMGLMGLPLADWKIYCEPAHAMVRTPPSSPDFQRVRDLSTNMYLRLGEAVADIRRHPRPGLIDALINCEIGGAPAVDTDVNNTMILLIGGGFDTTTALTAHGLQWLSEHPDERLRLARERDTLLDSATEEFLRFFTPAVGDGRTISPDCTVGGVELKEGERLWLSWAMANRDERVFVDADRVVLDRSSNRHTSFGLGVHRCIGSNLARLMFKRMLVAVLDRMLDYHCDPDGAEYYESVGVINGMSHLWASFTPDARVGPSLAETIDTLQRACIEQGLAKPVAIRGGQQPEAQP